MMLKVSPGCTNLNPHSLLGSHGGLKMGGLALWFSSSSEVIFVGSGEGPSGLSKLLLSFLLSKLREKNRFLMLFSLLFSCFPSSDHLFPNLSTKSSS
jgi:hypothetical protein